MKMFAKAGNSKIIHKRTLKLCEIWYFIHHHIILSSKIN